MANKLVGVTYSGSQTQSPGIPNGWNVTSRIHT